MLEVVQVFFFCCYNKYFVSIFCYLSDATSSRSNISNNGTNLLIMSAQQSDMFGTTDAVCKFILEGHDRGVNWASTCFLTYRVYSGRPTNAFLLCIYLC
jgi:hypothetical protein